MAQILPGGKPVQLCVSHLLLTAAHVVAHPCRNRYRRPLICCRTCATVDPHVDFVVAPQSWPTCPTAGPYAARQPHRDPCGSSRSRHRRQPAGGYIHSKRMRLRTLASPGLVPRSGWGPPAAVACAPVYADNHPPTPRARDARTQPRAAAQANVRNALEQWRQENKLHMRSLAMGLEAQQQQK